MPLCNMHYVTNLEGIKIMHHMSAALYKSMAALRQTYCQESVAFCILFFCFSPLSVYAFFTVPIPLAVLFSSTLFDPLNLISKSFFLRDTYPLRHIFCTYEYFRAPGVGWYPI